MDPSDELRLDGRVAVVTGAGRGLGRAHALLLASRGAAVVVNDLGVELDGTGAGTTAAGAVVDEIVAAGGAAVADRHSVDDPVDAEAIVATAVDLFGRVDIVVNNAGILRDKSFRWMTAPMVDDVLRVHVAGAFNVIRAAWPHFVDQGFGRVLLTSSAAGLFGNFGQANYSAAKAGLIGLGRTLAIEGAKYGITANVIAPVARTRMTEKLLGRFADRVAPELVSPLLIWLAHPGCTVNGHVYSVGGGRIARVVVAMTPGWARTDGQLTPEDVRDHLDEIDDTSAVALADTIADDFRALRNALAAESVATSTTGAVS